MIYAKSDEGQLVFDLLCTIGMTPDEFRNLDPRDSHFLLYAHTEKYRRQADHK